MQIVEKTIERKKSRINTHAKKRKKRKEKNRAKKSKARLFKSRHSRSSHRSGYREFRALRGQK